MPQVQKQSRKLSAKTKVGNIGTVGLTTKKSNSHPKKKKKKHKQIEWIGAESNCQISLELSLTDFSPGLRLREMVSSKEGGCPSPEE
jgi:hypothetical protein